MGHEVKPAGRIRREAPELGVRHEFVLRLDSMANKRTTRPPRDAWFGVILRLLGGRIPRPPRLVHEKHIRTSMARAYYDVLNEDEAFWRALANLLDHWTWRGAEQFAQRWRLPESGLADLTWTHSLWRQGFLKAPRLQIGSRSYPGVDDAKDEDNMRRLGYRPHPPRLKDVRSLRCGALRLYRRAVLGWPWNKIAEAESEKEERSIDVKSIHDGVHRWAGALGVPLPKRPRGRPRASPKSGV